MEIKNWVKVAASVALAQLAGVPGAAFTRTGSDPWYQQLEKPAFNPPTWVFPVAWTILYTMMGVSLFLVWQKGLEKDKVKQALIPFSIQWVLNALWSPIFFGLKAPLVALGEVALLWGAIVWTMAQFYRLSRPAAWLLLPYLLWVSFAAILNGAIWWLNKD